MCGSNLVDDPLFRLGNRRALRRTADGTIAVGESAVRNGSILQKDIGETSQMTQHNQWLALCKVHHRLKEPLVPIGP